MKHTLSKTYITAIFLVVMICSLPLAGQAQSIWLDDPGQTSEVGIELMIPSYDNIDVEGVAFASYLYSHIPVSDKIALQFDLPISHFSNGGGEANFAIRNPYIGFEYSSSPNWRWDLGARVPVANDSENALNSGLIVENYEIGPFATNAVTIQSNIHYRSAHETGFGYRLGGGLEGLIATKGSGGTLYVKYYGQLVYSVDNFTFGGGLNGRIFTTESGISFSDRSNHNAAISASYDFGRMSLGSYLEIPLDDDFNNFLNAVVGLNARISF